MPKSTEITIGEAKGRQMLHWVGKRPLDRVTAYPAQLVETFNPTGEDSRTQGLLFHGDNKDVLAWLLANGYRGQVDLIYIDPPFDSGADYVRKVQLRGVQAPGLRGQSYSLGEQVQYTDIWTNDMYLQFMYERFLLLDQLLSDNGSLFLHCDYRKAHHLRCLLDEVFGSESMVNEIIWRSTTFTGSSKTIAKRYPTNHNTLYWYHKGDSYTFHKVYEDYREKYLARFQNPDGDPRGPWQSVSLKTYSDETFERLKSEERLIPAKSAGAGWRFKFYLSETKGKVVETIWLDLEAGPSAIEHRDVTSKVSSMWLDINMANSMAEERTGYPTQKPDDLLARIIEAHSDPQGIILDCFVGSGTTAVVAQRLGRRWIAADINKGSIQTTSKRLQTVIRGQIEAHVEPQQGTLGLVTSDDDTLLPAALSFSVYRVNDYDLQIQHNEAVNLVVEHLGIDRTRTDNYFDGTQGKKLVKIIAFNHPLTPLDLQALKDELGARPDEDRDILVVCLGKETKVAPWLEEYNRHRPINKIDVIELRTDQKYGKFLVHEPAQADVAIRREGEEVVIEIVEFISPTIVKRLEMDLPLFKAQIPDWRAMIDVVLIDTSYDGEVFDITLSDVPERKNDLAVGEYRLPVAEGETTVAVKIIDMLGEEVLVVMRV